MIASAIAQGATAIERQTAKDVDVLAELGERLECGRQLPIGAFFSGCKRFDVDAVRNSKEGHTHRRFFGGCGAKRELRLHGFEHGQRHHSTHAAQDGSARDSLLHVIHSV